MPTNRFDQFTPQQFLNTYVPLPFEDIVRAGMMKQQAYNQQSSNIDSVQDSLTKLNAVTADKNTLAKMQSNFGDTLGQYYDKDLADPGITRDLRTKIRGIASDPTLRTISNTYGLYQQTLGDIRDRQNKGEIITPDMEWAMLKRPLDEYTKAGGAASGAVFTPGTAGKYVDIEKELFDTYSKMSPDTLVNIAYDKGMRNVSKETLESRPGQLVAQLVQKDLMSNPLYKQQLGRQAAYHQAVNGINPTDYLTQEVGRIGNRTGELVGYEKHDKDVKELSNWYKDAMLKFREQEIGLKRQALELKKQSMQSPRNIVLPAGTHDEDAGDILSGANVEQYQTDVANLEQLQQDLKRSPNDEVTKNRIAETQRSIANNDILMSAYFGGEDNLKKTFQEYSNKVQKINSNSTLDKKGMVPLNFAQFKAKMYTDMKDDLDDSGITRSVKNYMNNSPSSFFYDETQQQLDPLGQAKDHLYNSQALKDANTGPGKVTNRKAYLEPVGANQPLDYFAKSLTAAFDNNNSFVTTSGEQKSKSQIFKEYGVDPNNVDKITTQIGSDGKSYKTLVHLKKEIDAPGIGSGNLSVIEIPTKITDAATTRSIGEELQRSNVGDTYGNKIIGQQNLEHWGDPNQLQNTLDKLPKGKSIDLDDGFKIVPLASDKHGSKRFALQTKAGQNTLIFNNIDELYQKAGSMFAPVGTNEYRKPAKGESGSSTSLKFSQSGFDTAPIDDEELDDMINDF